MRLRRQSVVIARSLHARTLLAFTAQLLLACAAVHVVAVPNPGEILFGRGLEDGPTLIDPVAEVTERTRLAMVATFLETVSGTITLEVTDGQTELSSIPVSAGAGSNAYGGWFDFGDLPGSDHYQLTFTQGDRVLARGSLRIQSAPHPALSLRTAWPVGTCATRSWLLS